MLLRTRRCHKFCTIWKVNTVHLFAVYIYALTRFARVQAVEKVARLAAAFPDLFDAVVGGHAHDARGDLLLRVFRRYYPDHLIPGADPEEALIVPKLLENAGLFKPSSVAANRYGSDDAVELSAHTAQSSFRAAELPSWEWCSYAPSHGKEPGNASLLENILAPRIPTGVDSPHEKMSWFASRTRGGLPPSQFYLTPQYSELLACMAQDILLDHSVCLVGPRGTGKSAVVAELARQFGFLTSEDTINATHGVLRARDGHDSFGIEVVQVFKDMTSRDLLQRRVTNDRGDTDWESSPLVQAALSGRIAVLDGIHRLEPGALATLNELCHDRNLTLYDGTSVWKRWTV